jgi:hypothetical protein
MFRTIERYAGPGSFTAPDGASFEADVSFHHRIVQAEVRIVGRSDIVDRLLEDWNGSFSVGDEASRALYKAGDVELALPDGRRGRVVITGYADFRGNGPAPN